MRLPARLWFRRAHLILGLALGAVLVAVAGSGAALVFRDEIKALDPAARDLASAWDGAGDMGFAAARDLARAARPGHTLQTLMFPNQVHPYYEAGYLSPSGQEFTGDFTFHPATGAELARPSSPVLDWIEHFHVNLHLGDFGAFLVRWCTLLFSLILLTGLYLWWPGLKPRLWFAIRQGKLRLWDAHRVLGFFATIPLLLMLVSGVVFAFPAARQAVFLATGSAPPDSVGVDLNTLKNPPPPPDHAADISDEALLARARELSPPDAFVFYLTFPAAPDDTRQVRLQRGYSPFPYGEVHRVYFDRYTGAVLGHLKPDTSVASYYLASLNSELHYGTLGGRVTKTLWFIACALVPFFAITGVLLWRRRARPRPR
jgi:uncharacterized iron-regulated membrane protein